MINVTYGEASNQAEEDALIAQGCVIVVRTDLLPQVAVPNQPQVVYQRLEETNFASAYMAEQHSDNLNLASSDFKISLEFKLSTLSNGAHQFIMSKGSSLNSAWYIMYESMAATGALGHIYIVNSNNNVAIDIVSGITDTTSYHKLEIERINGVTKAYLDGVEKGTTTLPLIDTSGLLYIGAWNYSPNSHRFLGHMKNVTITKG